MAPARVNLQGFVGTGVILEWPSGVVYVSQAGGVYCLAMSEEGIFVPWFNDVDLDVVPPVFHNDVHAELSGRTWGKGGVSDRLTPAEADLVDSILAASSMMDGLRVDRARLGDSCEAWVRLTVGETARIREVVSGLDPFPQRGVLIWANSD